MLMPPLKPRGTWRWDGRPVVDPPGGELDGSYWTPYRDGNGNVTAASYTVLPLMQWVWLYGGAHDTAKSVEPLPEYPNNYGSSSFDKKLKTWNGAAYDRVLQRMYCHGAGHGDCSAAETEVLCFDIKKMAWSIGFPRLPYNSCLRPVDPTNTIMSPLRDGNPDVPVPNVPGDGDYFGNGRNAPMFHKTEVVGYPGGRHEYYANVFISPAKMAGLATIHSDDSFLAPVYGGMYAGANARCVYNLDTGKIAGKLYWGTRYTDTTDMAMVMDGNVILEKKGYSTWIPWDLAQTEQSEWQTALKPDNVTLWDPDPGTPSTGKYLPDRVITGFQHAKNYSIFQDMESRREALVISFSVPARRIRYGQAMDAGATNWNTYYDSITFTSANGTDHLDFNEAAFDSFTGQRLADAGADFDETTQAIWVCASTHFSAATGGDEGFRLYKLTGIDTGNVLTVKKFDVSPLIKAVNGLYGRMRLFRVGSQLCAVRIIDEVTISPQVIVLERP